jgi:hypothetical protein
MKILLLISLSVCLFFISCSKNNDNKLTLSNFQAYAFPVENGWEVNATATVKGFNLESKDGKSSARLSYTVDLVKLNGDTVKSITADNIDADKNEEITDLPVEAQVVLDSTYNIGKYKIILNVEDKLSQSKISSIKELELE